MSSSKKTKFLRLNKWELFDYPEMNDFNGDNRIIDNFFKRTAIEISNLYNEIFSSDYIKEVIDKLIESKNVGWNQISGDTFNSAAGVFEELAANLNIGINGLKHKDKHIVLNGRNQDQGVSCFTGNYQKKEDERVGTMYSGLFDYCHNSLHSDIPLRTPTGSFMIFQHEYSWNSFTLPFGIIATAESPSNGSFSVPTDEGIEIHDLNYDSPFMLDIIAVDPNNPTKLERKSLFDYYEYCYNERGEYGEGEEFDDRLEWVNQIKNGGGDNVK